tara:strand:+ start:3350 stop:3934 length:585 start_codon:yes stop_codon:yes gene_type:complete
MSNNPVDNFHSDIPDEYLADGFDFGFEAVDADELSNLVDDAPVPPSATEVAGAISSQTADAISNDLDKVEDKLNAVLRMLGDLQDAGGTEPAEVNVDMSRVEEKLDTILNMQNQEVLAAVGEQGDSIRAIIDEVEERKAELDTQFKGRLKAVEQEVLPLLIHLAKNDDKEYLYWPNRVEVVKRQIGKVLSATRG